MSLEQLFGFEGPAFVQVVLAVQPAQVHVPGSMGTGAGSGLGKIRVSGVGVEPGVAPCATSGARNGRGTGVQGYRCGATSGARNGSQGTLTLVAG